MAKRSYKAVSVAEARAMDRSELRTQYAKLSYVARQRIKGLAAQFPGYADVENYGSKMREYAPLRSLKGESDQQIAMRYSQLTRYLAQGTSTERGFRSSLEQTVERLNEHGYDYITTENVIAFYRFMEDARQRGVEDIYGSEQMVELFERAHKRGLSRSQIIANMEYWSEAEQKRKAEELRTGRKIPTKKARFYASRGRKSDYD